MSFVTWIGDGDGCEEHDGPERCEFIVAREQDEQEAKCLDENPDLILRRAVAE